MMNKTSTKKLFFYISISLVLCYFLFVIFAYNANVLTVLYTLEEVSFYYITAYVLLSATLYTVDTQTRKEPGFLVMFCLPAITFLFMLGMMLLAGITWQFYIVLILVIFLVYLLGYLVNKKWIEKIMMIQHGYDYILLGYVILHLFIVLFIVFKMLHLL